MFVTTPEFEQKMPLRIGPADARYWDAMVVSLRLPWFLVDTHREDQDVEFVQTFALTQERSLIHLLQNNPPEDVLSAYYIAPGDVPSGGWTMARIAELWLPSSSEEIQTGPLLIVCDGVPGMLDSFQSKASEGNLERTLLRRFET